MSDLLSRYTNLPELERLLSEQESGTRSLDALHLADALRQRVRGQDHIIDDLAPLLASQYGKLVRKQPVANLMFVGPTGTGKTELCKALAEYLFEDENAALLYDCAELKQPGATTRLIGVPQGYHGGEGKLTTALQTNKQRIIVFDEIEKAHPDVFDLFLSMMGDGRLTDQRTGRSVDLTESIIVLTSNAQQDELEKLSREIKNPEELNNAVRVQLREAGVFRPEIIGRLTRILVFRQLEGLVRVEIALLKMRKIAAQYGIELQYVSPNVLRDVVEKGEKLKDFGARQREQVVEDMLATLLLQARQQGLESVCIDHDDNGQPIIQPADSAPQERLATNRDAATATEAVDAPECDHSHGNQHSA